MENGAIYHGVGCRGDGDGVLPGRRNVDNKQIEIEIKQSKSIVQLKHKNRNRENQTVRDRHPSSFVSQKKETMCSKRFPIPHHSLRKESFLSFLPFRTPRPPPPVTNWDFSYLS